jgi:hypothetical protein
MVKFQLNIILPSTPVSPQWPLSLRFPHKVLQEVMMIMIVMMIIRILNPLTPKLNPSAQRCLPRFLLGILIFKGLTARRF